MKNLFILFIVSFFAFGCSYTTINSNVMMEPKVQAPAQRIEIVKIDSRSFKNHSMYDTLTNNLKTLLANIKKDGSNVFEVVERETLVRILKEQQFQMTISDPDTNIELGRLVGIEAGIEVDFDYNRTRTYIYEIPVLVHNLEITLTFIDYSTGTISFKKTYNEVLYEDLTGMNRTEYKGLKDNFYNLPGISSIHDFLYDGGYTYEKTLTEYNLKRDNVFYRDYDNNVALHKVVTAVFDKISNDFGNYELLSELKISTKADNISKNDKDAFDRGIKFAKNNKIDQACELWNSISNRNTNSVYLNYNLGVCNEVKGDFDDALNYYNKANSLEPKADDLITLAIKRVKTLI